MDIMYYSMAPLLVVLLIVFFYISIIQAVNHVLRSTRSYYSGNLLFIDITISVMYLIIWAVFGLLYIYSGYDMLIIWAALFVQELVAIVLLVRFFVNNRNTMQMRVLYIIGLYSAAVLYLTIFGRIGAKDVDVSINMNPLYSLASALRNGDAFLLWHMFLNIVLFIPFGYLIPEMNPIHLNRWQYAFLGGVITSTIIESIQLVFGLGQCDIDDIISNSMGALIGYLLVKATGTRD